MLRSIFGALLWIFILSGIPAAFLGAWGLYQYRNVDNLIKYQGMLLTAIGLYFTGGIIGASRDTPHIIHSDWFWWWYLPALVLVVGAMWLLDACIFGLISRGGKEQ